MDWQGKINFQKPITIEGKPHGVEHVSSLPTWQTSDQGRVVHTEDDNKLWFATDSEWQELTPGGVGVHNHDDLYYTEGEIDSFFEPEIGGKKQIDYTNVINIPTTFAPSNHDNTSHTETYITSNGVTFENLQTNGDIGTGPDQLAIGSHNHDGIYEPTFTKNTGFNLDIGITAGTVAEGNHNHDGVYEPTFTKNTGFNLDLGTTAGTVAEGNHNHDGVYEPTFTKNTGFNLDIGITAGTVAEGNHSHSAALISYDNTTSGLAATDIKAAIDELDSNLESLNVNAATYEALAAVGDVGTGSDQLAQGDHTHSEYEITQPVSGALYVDVNRNDSYTEDGSLTRPYKTIASAITNISGKKTIILQQGTYTESIVLPGGVELISNGNSWMQGPIVVGDGTNGTTTLKNMTISEVLTVNVGVDNTCKTNNVYVHNNGYVVLQSGNLEGDLGIDTTTTNPALSVSSGSFFSSGQRFTSAGTNTILQTGGRIVLSTCEIVGASTGNLVESTGGTLVFNQTQAINTGGGLAINVNNSGNPSDPNLFSDVFHFGGIDINACLLVAEGIVGDIPTTQSGGVVSYRGADQISYDNGSSGLTAINTQQAVDEINTKIQDLLVPSTAGAPVDTPQTNTVRFDASTNTLYIYNGTAWVSTTLS